MNPKDLFDVSIQHMNSVVDHIKDTQWHDVTPCAPWDLRQLLNHVTYEWLWAPELFAGKTIKEVGNKYEGDVLGGSPIKSYMDAAAGISESVKALDIKKTVHLSYADVPGSEYLFQLTIEALIHGWDMAKTIDYGTRLPANAVDALYKVIQKNKSEITDSGYYGHEKKVKAVDSPQTKLLALVGRTP